MNRIKKLRCRLLGLTLVLCPLFLLGHNPLSARYHLEAGEHASLMKINLSQAGINQVLQNQYSKEFLAGISRVDLEELIVDYVKGNFTLSIDGQMVELKKGGIRLGSHQTDLKFVLPPLPKSVHSLVVDIPAFRENENHQTIFSYHIGGRSDHAILAAQNDFQSVIMLPTALPSQNWMGHVLLGSLGICMILGLVMWMRAGSLKLLIQY